MNRETLAQRIWWQTDVPVFLEKVILPLLATVITAFVLLNPMKFDWQSRIALTVGLLAFAFLISHQIHLRNEAIRLGSAPKIEGAPTPGESPTGSASATGADVARNSVES